MMGAALTLMAVTLSIGMAPAADAWWGHEAWDSVDVTASSYNSWSSHTQTESACGITTTIKANAYASGNDIKASWDAPSTCNGEPFDRVISVLYINGVKEQTSYYDERNYEYSYGEINTGDHARILNLYYYGD